MQTPSERLMRSRTDKMIAGVAGGIGRYLAIDSAIIRLVFIALAFSGIGLLIYPVLWVIMPREPAPQPDPAQPGTPYSHASGTGSEAQGQEIPIQNVPPAGNANATEAQAQRNRVLGMILVGIGAFLILSKTLPWLAPFLIPLLLIGAGVVLLRRAA